MTDAALDLGVDSTLCCELIEELVDQLANIDDSIVLLEKEPTNLTLINNIFRCFHNIKGASSYVNSYIPDLVEKCHYIEDILNKIRSKELQVNTQIIDTIILYKNDLSAGLQKAMKNMSCENKYVTAPPSTPIKSEPGKVNELETVNNLSAEEQIDHYPAEVPEELHNQFEQDVKEKIGDAINLAIEMEKSGVNQDKINAIFRYVHTIKGNSEYLGLKKIIDLSHSLESVLDHCRKQQISWTGMLPDLVVEGLKKILELVDALRTREIVKYLDLKDKLLFVTKGSGNITSHGYKNEQEKSEVEPPIDETLAFYNMVQQSLDHLALHVVKIEKENYQEKICHIKRLINNIIVSANYLEMEETFSKATELENCIHECKEYSGEEFLAYFKDEIFKWCKEIESSVKRECERRASAEGGTTPPKEKKNDHETSNGTSNGDGSGATVVGNGSSVDPANKTGTATGATGKLSEKKKKVQTTIRIDEQKLDDLMNTVGELVTLKNAFDHLSIEFDNWSKMERQRKNIESLKTLTHTLGRISDDLRDITMDMRLVPINILFKRFPVLVRDVSKKLNKKIELQIAGGETELDKHIIEVISDPLIHLLRNAVDHGVESPDERAKTGKSEMAIIELKAYQEGNSVVIEVKDDGRGIDTEKIKSKVIEKGLMKKEALTNLSVKDVYELIFLPGLSTATYVTDISGRGVGMDVVKNNIGQVNGHVEVFSQKGEGTSFKISLPLTMAVISVLFFRASNKIMALPLDSISEIIRLKSDQLTSVKNDLLAQIRGEVINIKYLSDLLCLKKKELDRKDILEIIIVKERDKKIGIIVDETFNQQEVVIRPLGHLLSDNPYFFGSTILGNGQVVVILNPVEIFATA